MDALQREILQERSRFFDFVQPSIVGSMGGFGLRGGLPPSAKSWSFGESQLPAAGVIIMQLQARPTPRPQVSGFRERELKWRRTHAETLKSLENQWVVLEGEQIVAHGNDPVQVINEAKSKGVNTPYIFFVEQKSENVARIGL